MRQIIDSFKPSRTTNHPDLIYCSSSETEAGNFDDRKRKNNYLKKSVIPKKTPTENLNKEQSRCNANQETDIFDTDDEIPDIEEIPVSTSQNLKASLNQKKPDKMSDILKKKREAAINAKTKSQKLAKSKQKKDSVSKEKKTKKKHNVISLQLKLDIIEMKEDGAKIIKIARDKGLGESTIRGILKKER